MSNVPRMHHNTFVLLALLLAQSLLANEVVYQYEDDLDESSLILPATDLQQLGMQSRRIGVPLVIEFSTPWCEYCDALEQQVLEPMLRNKNYADRMLLRKIVVEDSNEIIDFTGRKISASQFAVDNKLDLSPTLVFYSGSGKEIEPRVVGITVLEFIPQKIDSALESALQKISADR